MSNSAAGLVSAGFIRWLKGVRPGGGKDERRAPTRDSTGSRIAMRRSPGHGAAWGTLSGLAAHPSNPRLLYACTDQDSPPARILEIDVSRTPARVVRQIEIAVPGVHHLDIEGISAKRDGGFWLASEGGDYNDPPNLLLDVDAGGRLIRAVVLPAEIVGAVQKKGLEGVSVVDGAAGPRLYVTFQVHSPMTRRI